MGPAPGSVDRLDEGPARAEPFGSGSFRRGAGTTWPSKVAHRAREAATL